MDPDDHAVLHHCPRLGLFRFRKRDREVLASLEQHKQSGIQLSGAGVYHGTQQVPLCLCDDQGGPGVETGTAVSGSKNEWGISMGRVEDRAGTFMHSGLLFRGDPDLYGYDR